MLDFEKQERLIRERLADLEARLSHPDVIGNPRELAALTRQHRRLQRLNVAMAERAMLIRQRQQAREMIEEGDEEIAEMARLEIEEADERIEALENQIRLLLLPPDPNDEKNTILEIRAGTGGTEAALFAADLARMYQRFCENRNWRMNLISATESELGGFKEAVFSIEGENVFSQLKFESGTHRVQRVPVTEASGRIHTSAVTVAVLPEADEVDIAVRPEDLRIDTFHSQGHGGQSVNTTDSAVRVTHMPTGLVVSCQDEKSQIKNRAKALKVLRARLFEMEQSRLHAERSSHRSKLVGSGDRSQRIRTYNFPENRVTDHRVNYRSKSLDLIMDGQIEEMIGALIAQEQAERLASETELTRSA